MWLATKLRRQRRGELLEKRKELADVSKYCTSSPAGQSVCEEVVDTARRRPMSGKLDWEIAIVGYDLTQQARYLDAILDARQSGGPEPVMDSGRRQTYFVQFIDDNDGRRSFYEALLKIKWLPSTIRRAVMRELGQSLQKHKRSIEDARTVTLEFLVKQCKAQMRANGERPQGGIHEAAVAQVATSQGMSPEALKQRITRRKKRPSK